MVCDGFPAFLGLASWDWASAVQSDTTPSNTAPSPLNKDYVRFNSGLSGAYLGLWRLYVCGGSIGL